MSCITNKKIDLSIGAGVYHLQFNKITTVNSGGTSINKTINRAELAGIAAALINEHTHIAIQLRSTGQMAESISWLITLLKQLHFNHLVDSTIFLVDPG
jgi:hypothetical protein